MKSELLKLPLPVVESTRHVGFYVGEELCRRGKRDNPGACALALAARRDIRGLQGVQVYRAVAYLVFKTHIERFVISTATRKAIEHFDRTGEFRPGLYEFAPVNPSARLAFKRANKKPTVYAVPVRRRPKVPQQHFARTRGSGSVGVSVVPAPRKARN